MPTVSESRKAAQRYKVLGGRRVLRAERTPEMGS